MKRLTRAFARREGATATELLILLVLVAVMVLAVIKMLGATMEEKVDAANQEIASLDKSKARGQEQGSGGSGGTSASGAEGRSAGDGSGGGSGQTGSADGSGSAGQGGGSGSQAGAAGSGSSDGNVTGSGDDGASAGSNQNQRGANTPPAQNPNDPLSGDEKPRSIPWGLLFVLTLVLGGVMAYLTFSGKS